MGCGASKASEPTLLSGGAANRRSEPDFQEVGVVEEVVEKPCVQDYFELGDKIGKGTFGYCFYAVTRTTGVPVAVKSLMRKNKRFNKDSVAQELQMLRRVNHPSCLSVIAHFEDDEAVHIVTTLAPGGDLLDRLLAHGSMGDSDTAYVVRQLMEALNYLHANDFVHRDVKPENILMMSKDPASPHFNRILLSDFGMAQQRPNIHTNVLKTLIGTPEFSAPEVLAIARHGCTPGVPNSTQYSCAIDLWATGCVTYTMLSSTTPFTSHKGTNVPGMIDRILHGRFSFANTAWAKVSPQAIDIIRRLLTVSPTSRLTAPQALLHPFLSSQGEVVGPFSVFSDELPAIENRGSLSMKQSVLGSRIAAMGGSSFATFANMASATDGGVDQDDSFTMRQSPFEAAGAPRRAASSSRRASTASGTGTTLASPSAGRVPLSPHQGHLQPPSPGLSAHHHAAGSPHSGYAPTPLAPSPRDFGKGAAGAPRYRDAAHAPPEIETGQSGSGGHEDDAQESGSATSQ
eukprot:CAMPEP_0174917722 /NCGR_PEP_ID=MMETSP1355-20121228/2642_1 /TAXON_ID=464990 /ORGANISM="Hemiselmis tepida, Strain CCMP443" /LENGTH=514 /DNA_ID=CAMNT_0016162847 /DNA_START=32 /DNA_END=1573 /DNA_ORIENTATION=+